MLSETPEERIIKWLDPGQYEYCKGKIVIREAEKSGEAILECQFSNRSKFKKGRGVIPASPFSKRIPLPKDQYRIMLLPETPSSRITISTRRFCCRPGLVSLLATGKVSP